MEHKGTVYFFAGLSGAGKTAVGSLFYQRPGNTKSNAVYLGGNETRVAFEEDMGYTNDERLRWTGRIFRVCRLPSDQDIDVMCCSITMFDTVRRWSRKHIPGCKKTYIRIKKGALVQRNQRGLYTGGRNVVGVNPPFGEPRSPDLVLQNDGERTSLELTEGTEGALYPNIVEYPIDNIDYWNLYYQNKLCPTSPSPSARCMSTLVESGWTLTELGYSDERGALYFASPGLGVAAMDFSRTATGMLRQQPVPHVRFVCGDFVSHTLHQLKSHDYTYSRLIIHAINRKQERMLLGSMARALKPGGKSLVEVHSVHDLLYGKGEALKRSAFPYDNYYRRFLMLDELTEVLRQAGFRIEYAREQTDFAPYGNDDPPVVRVVAVEN